MMCRLCLQNIFQQQNLLPDDVAREIADYLIIRKKTLQGRKNDEANDRKKAVSNDQMLISSANGFQLL